MSVRSNLGRATVLLVFVSTMGATDRFRLERETQRLARLREDLNRLTTARDERTPEQHLDAAAREIDEIEGRLRAPFGNPHPPTHEEYRRVHLNARAREQAETMRMLRKTESDLSRAGLDRDQEFNLRAWKTRLENDLVAPTPDLEHDLADSDEQIRTRAEREGLERRVADLRAEVKYWSEQRSGGGLPSKTARVRALRAQIEAQETTVGLLGGGAQDARE